MTLKSKKRIQRQVVNMKHSWRVGELCTAVYDNLGEGVIYRVSDVKRQGTSPLLVIVPVFGVIVDIEGKRPRVLDARYCTPMNLVDLGTSYVNFGLFIAEESRRLGDAVKKGDAEETPTGLASDLKEESPGLDGRGLLADIRTTE